MLNSTDEHGTKKYLCSKEFEPQILLAFVIVRGGTKTELNQFLFGITGVPTEFISDQNVLGINKYSDQN